MKKKIPLPWATEPTTADRRLEQTLRFWTLVQSWNNSPKSKVGALTVRDAITECNTIMDGLDPKSTLSNRIYALRDNIVIHGTKSRKKKHDLLHQPHTHIKTKLYVM